MVTHTTSRLFTNTDGHNKTNLRAKFLCTKSKNYSSQIIIKIVSQNYK